MSQHPLAFSFIIVTAVLLLLYGWTLSETVSLTVEIGDGQCTALLGERSSTIPCPEITGGKAGVYLTSISLAQRMRYKPLDLLVPDAAWESIRLVTAEGERENIVPDAGQAFGANKAIFWDTPEAQTSVIEGRVRRPDNGQAGILLLGPQGEDGWLFMIDSENRQGVWRRWQDNQPADTIAGVPYQKPVLSQAQSLLSELIATFLGALAVIVVVGGVGWVVRRVRYTLNGEQLGQFQRSESRGAKPVYAVLIAALAIFGITLWFAVDELERVPHVQDSITFLFQAQTLAQGALWAPQPPQPEAFKQEFLTVADGKWFGQYPPGYPLVLAVGVLLGAPWLVNPLLAVMSSVLLIKLGMLLYRPSTGLLAGGLALLSPFFLFLSGSLMVHAAELFWTLLAIVCWTMALRAPFRLRWALFAGSAMGMLLLTRQITAAAIGISYMTLLLPAEARAQQDGAHHHASIRRMGRQTAVAVAAVLPFVMLLLSYQRALTGSPWQDPRLLERPFDHPGFGPDIGESENAFKLATFESGLALTWYTDPDQPPRGHSLARGLYNTQQNLEALASGLFGWYPSIALAFCWIPFLLARPRRYDWLLLALLATIMAVYVSYWTTGIMFGPRYYYAALPALLLLTARGIQTLGSRFGRAATISVMAAIVILTLVFYWPGAVASLRGYNFISGEERILVEGQIEGQALVFVPVNDWWDYGRFFSGNTPWLDGRIIYARDLGEESNSRLQAIYAERQAYLFQPETKTLRALSK
ncbi:MAG: ArnT family glycosyltransferase [Candidatus Promineifilaceae bacterium]